MHLQRHGLGIAWLAVVAFGCTHGENRCAEMDGGWDAPCLNANDGCEARGTCPGPAAPEPEPPVPCESEEDLLHALYLDPPVGYELPAEMIVDQAEYGLLSLVGEESSHRIEVAGIAFHDWFSEGESVSLDYRVDAPFRGLEVAGETSTLFQLSQSSAPLPTGFRALANGTGCTFERAVPGPGPHTHTIGGLRVVDTSMRTQLTEPGEVLQIDGWVVAGVSRTTAASSDGTRPQRDVWVAVAVGPRAE
ncbi:MAG: hypothetical protein AB8I08_15725 [Sandaracinaceae bacterium]